MTVFGSYASYYDILYQDKDYQAEIGFVAKLLARFAEPGCDVLELGCGTGLHGLMLAETGYRVDGIDLSQDMLAIAEARRQMAPLETASRVAFLAGDLRTFSLGRRYGAAISLFHVMSYQTTDEDLMRTLSGVRRHLELGAPFIFDFWHGPAVAASGPIARTKTMENASIRVARETTPVWHPDRDVVEVCYHLTVTDKRTDAQLEIDERHEVRYLFVPHVSRCLKTAGFRLVESGEWMTGLPAADDTFGVYVVAIAE